jgi:hypothetical protein
MSAQPDQISPNYLTIDDEGRVGAMFTGGLQLTEAAALAPLTDSTLAWVDSTGAVHEIVAGLVQGGVHQLLLLAEGPSSEVIVTADPQTRFLLDSSERSDYLMVGRGNGPIKSSIGTGTLTWPAASALSNVLTIPLLGAAGNVFGVFLPSAIAGVDQVIVEKLTTAGGAI